MKLLKIQILQWIWCTVFIYIMLSLQYFVILTQNPWRNICMSIKSYIIYKTNKTTKIYTYFYQFYNFGRFIYFSLKSRPWKWTRNECLNNENSDWIKRIVKMKSIDNRNASMFYWDVLHIIFKNKWCELIFFLNKNIFKVNKSIRMFAKFINFGMKQTIL